MNSSSNPFFFGSHFLGQSDLEMDQGPWDSESWSLLTLVIFKVCVHYWWVYDDKWWNFTFEVLFCFCDKACNCEVVDWTWIGIWVRSWTGIASLEVVFSNDFLNRASLMCKFGRGFQVRLVLTQLGCDDQVRIGIKVCVTVTLGLPFGNIGSWVLQSV